MVDSNQILDGYEAIRTWAPLQGEQLAAADTITGVNEDPSWCKQFEGLMAGIPPNSQAHLHLAMSKGAVGAVRVLLQLGWTDFQAPASGWSVHEKRHLPNGENPDPDDKNASWSVSRDQFGVCEFIEDTLGCEYTEDSKGTCYGFWNRSDRYITHSGKPVTYDQGKSDRSVACWRCCFCKGQGTWYLGPQTYALVRPGKLASDLIPASSGLAKRMPQIIAALQDAKEAAQLQKWIEMFNKDRVGISLRCFKDKTMKMDVDLDMPGWLFLWHAAELSGVLVDNYRIQYLGGTGLSLEGSLREDGICAGSKIELMVKSKVTQTRGVKVRV